MFAPRHRHVQPPLPAVWQHQRAVPVSHQHHSGAHHAALRPRAPGVPGGGGVGPAHHELVPAVLPPAEAERQKGRPEEEAAPADGRDAAADHHARPHAPAGLEDQGADVCSASDAWQQLLAELRGDPRAPGPAAAPDAQPVVGAQPPDGVLLTQGHGKAHAQVGRLSHTWVVNTSDWIDVEHILRHMLRCEASDCYQFHSTGYVFFRSCAVMHVARPSDFLRAGTLYRFPDTEVVVEILEAHPEGVLEVGCYMEYVPI